MEHHSHWQKRMDAEITCAICLEHFRDPRILGPCLHYYCRECIERLAAKASSDNKPVSCPECSKNVSIHDVNALQPAFFINRLLPVVHEATKEQVHCSVSTHSRHEGSSSGTLPDPNYLQCAKHGKKCEVFCRDCTKLVCVQGAVTNHMQHHLEDIDAECIRKCKCSLKLQLEPVREQFAKLKDVMQKYEERELVIKKQVSMVANKIHQAFDEVDSTYLQYREATLSHLYQMEEMKVKAINSQKKALEVTVSHLESLLQLGDEFLDKGPGNELQSLALLEVLTSHIRAFILEDTLQLLVEPRADPNIAIEIADPIPANVTEEYCRLYLLQPDPPHCSASGTGLLEAETAVTSTFHFHLKYANSLPCSEEQNISVSIQSSVSGPVEAQVSYQVNGDYKVTYTPTSRGRHEVRVVVNGGEISGSPFQLFVSNRPLRISSPVRVIKSQSETDGLSEIDGLTMNTDEQLVVSEKMKGEVSIWEKSGRKLNVIKVGEFIRCHVRRTPFLCRPTGVAVDNEGCIYVADNYNHCLAKFSRDGSRLLKIICREGPGNGELNSPGGIRVSEKGEVMICDCANHRVQVFNQTLQFQRSFGSKGTNNGEFNWPVDLDFDSSDCIYVSDMENHRIQVFNVDEEFVRSFGAHGSEPGQLGQPVFLFVDSENYLYVSEKQNHRVSIFRTNGDFVQVLGDEGEQESKMTSPKGITMDKDGFLYIGNPHWIKCSPLLFVLATCIVLVIAVLFGWLRNTATHFQIPGQPISQANANIHGLDIIAETSISVTNKSQTFHWTGYGLKLHIPSASLPAGVGPSDIVIKASLTGQFHFPENTTLVSAIFWLQCPVKFTKPVTLEIQHCGKHSGALSFVHAKHSQKDLPYQFKPLEGPRAVFSSEYRYGNVTLFSFSGLGIIQEGSDEQQYCARLYYFGIRINWKVHFVVIKDLEASNTVVNQNYKMKGAIEGPDQDIEFEKDSITMEIPEIDRWTVIVLTPAMIIKKERVDSYKSGHRIPSCQLQVKWTNDQPPGDIHKQVMLRGAKEPFNCITIQSDFLLSAHCTPEGTIRQREDAIQERCTIINDYTEVIRAIENDISNWRLLGEALRITSTELERVDKDEYGEQNKLRETIRLWQRRNPKNEFCWEKLLDALKLMKEIRLAKSISDQYGI